MLRCVASFVLVTSLIASATPTRAQDFQPDSALTVALASIEGESLGLDEAVSLSMRNATAIQEATAAAEAASAVAGGARGLYDPVLYGAADWSRDETPTASPFSGASVLESRRRFGQAGVRTRLVTGADVDASLDVTRAATNSVFAALNPQLDAFGQITVRQPLLAGRGIGTSGDFKAAGFAEAAAAARMEQTSIDVRVAVEELYWDLYAAERDLAVQITIVEQARVLLSESELRFRAGLVGPSESENAKVFLAEQELTAIDREEALIMVSNALATLLGRRPEAPLRTFKASDEPPADFAPADVDGLLALAMSSNRELEAAQAEVDIADVRMRSAKRNRLPAVDLIGSLSSTGLAGTAQDVIFGSDTLTTTASGSLGDAIGQVGGFDYPRWSVGVSVAVPLSRRARNSEAARLEADRDRAQARLDAVSRSVEEQVRLYHETLQNGVARIAIARRGVAASREQVRIGLIEFRNGRTTAFELVRLGADLATAERRLSQALVRIAKSSAALRRATGGQYDG
jgi:outer membrane protein TolC